MNDAFSLRYLVEKDSPLQLLHVLSQRIRLLEPGGADKVKAGNYVLHDDKDKCVALLAEADKRVILTIARDLPPCLQSACGMSAQEASLLADEFGVAEQAAPAILAVCDAMQEPGLCHGDSWGMSLDDAHALAAEFGDSNVPLICAPRGDGGEALVSLPLTTQRGSTDSLASAPVICMLPTAGFDKRAVVQAIILRVRRALGGVRFALLGLTAACNEQARARTVRALRGILTSVERTGSGVVAVGPVPSQIDGGEQRLIEVVAPSKIDGGGATTDRGRGSFQQRQSCFSGAIRPLVCDSWTFYVPDNRAWHCTSRGAVRLGTDAQRAVLCAVPPRRPRRLFV